MAAANKGTAHWFGMENTSLSSDSTLANAQIVSITGDHEFGLSESTLSNTGVTIETRKDDRIKRVNATVRGRANAEMPVIGGVVAVANCPVAAFNGNYEVDSVGIRAQNNQHFEVELTLVQHEGITYTV